MTNNEQANEDFNWDEVKYGVDKGQRHTTLTKYYNWLKKQYYSKDEIVTVLTNWNHFNRPPMYPEEVMNIIYDLWEKRPIRKLTLLGSDTDKADKEAALLMSKEINMMLAEKESIAIGPWLLEPKMEGCAYWRAILCKGTRYESVPLPCNEWMCRVCFPRMGKEWIEHLIEVTQGQQLYVMIVRNEYWPNVLWAINKVKADFVRIRRWRYDKSKVILNKRLDAASHVSSNKLPANKLESRLEAFMPDYPSSLRDYVEPICSSEGWKIPQRTVDPMTRMVVRTWLPVHRQKEVAFKLGAELCGQFGWESPKDVPQNEWEEKFIEEIENQEKIIREKLNRLDTRDELQTWQELYTLDGYPELFEGHYGEI